MREFWEFNRKESAITPEMLKKDSDKFGGASLLMMQLVGKQSVSVPLKRGCSYVNINVNQQTADRIMQDGGIDVDCDKFWNNINSSIVKKYFKDTTEEVPVITSYMD